MSRVQHPVAALRQGWCKGPAGMTFNDALKTRDFALTGQLNLAGAAGCRFAAAPG